MSNQKTFTSPAGVIVIANPQNLDVNPDDCIEATGLLPQIIDEAYTQWQDSDEGREAFIPALERAYGFPMDEIDGGTVNPKNLVYKYPGDPELHPLAFFATPTGESIVVYQYGLVAIRPDPHDRFFVTRMD